jgi:hypothetical protein
MYNITFKNFQYIYYVFILVIVNLSKFVIAAIMFLLSFSFIIISLCNLSIIKQPLYKYTLDGNPFFSISSSCKKPTSVNSCQYSK